MKVSVLLVLLGCGACAGASEVVEVRDVACDRQDVVVKRLQDGHVVSASTTRVMAATSCHRIE